MTSKRKIPLLSLMHECLALKQQRDEAIRDARIKFNGVLEGFTGENRLVRPLLGRKFLKYYYPSKHLLPDFRIENYIKMQVERFSPRESNPVIKELADTMRRCSYDLSKIRCFLKSVDKDTLFNNPTLQDLYSIYSILCNDYPFEFEMDNRIHQATGFKWEPLSNIIMSNNTTADSRCNNNTIGEASTTTKLDIALEKNKQLKEYFNKRHRFFDPLFRRRRLSYIDKIARNKLRKPKTRKLLGRTYFVHPDSREEFPDNFGSITVKWPSPFS